MLTTSQWLDLSSCTLPDVDNISMTTLPDVDNISMTTLPDVDNISMTGLKLDMKKTVTRKDKCESTNDNDETHQQSIFRF